MKKSVPRGQMKPLTPQQMATIEALLTADKDWRSVAMLRTAVDSMLRASDLLALTVDDVCGPHGIREDIITGQFKTNGTVLGALSQTTRDALALWLLERPEGTQWLWPGRQPGKPLTCDMYRREVKRWCKMARLDTRYYSTHSLRRTKAALIYAKTGNVEAVRRLLGHASVSATSRYLGVEDADALAIAREVQI